MAYSLAIVNLVAIWLEAAVYGPYVVLFFFTIQTIYRQSLESRRTSWTLSTACIVLAFLSTLHVICSVRMLVEAVIVGEEIPGGAAAYFDDEGTILAILRKGTFALSVLIADTLMMYRCYVLWNRTAWILAFPGLALCGTVISASFITKELLRYKPALEGGVFTPEFIVWVPIFFGIAFFNSLYLTGCIAFKLWNASRVARDNRNTMLKFKRTFATIVIVESNSIYPFMSLVALIFFLAQEDIQVVPVNLLAQVVVIAPTLMILQVQKGLYSPYSRSRLGISSQAFPSATIPNQDSSAHNPPTFQGFGTPYAFMPQPAAEDDEHGSRRRFSIKTLKSRLSTRTARKTEEGGVWYTTYGGTYPFVVRAFGGSAGKSDGGKANFSDAV